jgi:hypothetical protein
VSVVGDDAETSVGGVLLHDSSQSHLSSRGHSIGLIKNDKLEVCRAAVTTGLVTQGGEDLFCAGEGLDLLADDIDTTIIRGVEFEDHLTHVLVAIDATGESEDCRGLSGSWRAVEEEMG